MQMIEKLPTPGSRAWRAMVDYRLRHGWGVEDIAINLRCSPRQVRARIEGLRKAGKLREWWLADEAEGF